MRISRYLTATSCVLSLAITLAFVALPASAEGVWAGVFSYQKKMADYGHPEAQVKLGEMYEEGHGTEKDYDIAQQWYQKAAEQGYALGEEKLVLLEQRRQREAEERKRAEQQRIADEKAAQERREREKAEAEKRAEEERLREEQLAREAEQQRIAQELAAAAAADKAAEEERERQARQRAKEAIEELLATPDGLE